mgnify:CR=1 FL=1
MKKELPKELKVKIMRIRLAYSKIKKNFDSKQSEEIDYVINFVRESRGHEGADKIYLQNLSSDGLPINFSHFIFITLF